MSLSSDPLSAEPRATPGQRIATTLALLAVATMPLLPSAFAGHFPRTHEGMRYEHLAAIFLDAIDQGVFYPRWLPDLAGGYGYPTFVFYQPVVFYVASAISAVTGVGMIVGMQLVALTFSVIGSFGAFVLSRQFGVGRIAGLACAMLFLITPYVFVNLYVRGDHSEFAALMLTPWPPALLLIARKRLNESHRAAAQLLAAAFVLALLVATHPALAVCFVPLTIGLAIAGTPFVVAGRRRQWIASIGFVGVLLAALSSFYWFPVWQNAPFVHLEGVALGPYDPVQHTIDPWRLIYPRWGFGTSGFKAMGVPPTMSFQLGLPHLLLAVAGLIVGWRRPWVVMAAVAYAVLILCMTVYADAIWQIGSPLRVLQFPWRLLGPIAALQLLLASAAIARITPRRPIVQGSVALAVVVISAGYYHAMFHASPFLFQLTDHTEAELPWKRAQDVLNAGVQEIAHYPENFSGRGEFTPKWAPLELTEARRGPILLANGDVAFAPTSSNYRIDANVTLPTAQQAIIQQYYFPGWRVEVNGHVMPFEDIERDQDGRLVIALPAGTSHVVAYFDGPDGWRLRTVIAAIISAAAIVVIVRSDRRRPASPLGRAHEQERRPADVGGGRQVADAHVNESGIAE